MNNRHSAANVNDASFQLDLPIPSSSRDTASTARTRLLANTDPRSGLQTVYDPMNLPIPVYPTDPGPVHAHPTTGNLRSLKELGEAALKELSEAPGESERHVSSRFSGHLAITRLKRKVPATWSLGAQMALLVHFSSTKDYAGAIDRGALYLVDHIFLDTALFVPHQDAAAYQTSIAQASKLRIIFSQYVSFSLPSPEVQVLEILSTMGKIHQTANIDPSRLFIELLRLYFVDIFDHSSLDLCRVNWSEQLWLNLRNNNAGNDSFNDALLTISRMTAHQMEAEALETEEWIRSRIEIKLNSSNLRFENAKLPPRAIAFRILRVCVAVQNTMVQVWRSLGDARGNAQLWHLTRWEIVALNNGQPIVLDFDEAEHEANFRQQPLDRAPSLEPFRAESRGRNRIRNLFKRGKGRENHSIDG